MDLNAVGRDKARADGIEVQEEVELTPQDLVVEGLAHTQFETLFATPPEPTGSQDDLPTIDLPLIMPDEEPAAPAAAAGTAGPTRADERTSALQSREITVSRLPLAK